MKGSLFTEEGFAGLKAKGSGAAAAAAAGAAGAAAGAPGSFTLDANRSGSELPAGAPNGPPDREKGSSVEKAALEVGAKKESAAKGSEPLKGSPPNGSD